MKTKRPVSVRFAICLDNEGYPASLELHKVYRVLQDREAEGDGDLRVIDESGEDYLYPAEFFALVDVSPVAARALKRSFTGAVR